MNPKQKYISSTLNSGAYYPAGAYKPKSTTPSALDAFTKGGSSYSAPAYKPPTPVTPSNTSATGTSGTKITSPAQQTYVSSLANQPTQAPSMPAAQTKTEDYKNTPEYKSYLRYQREKENPSEASDARKAYEASQQRFADKQSENEARADELRREQRDILDASGGLKSGAIDSANMKGRRANDELSRLALEESAAARTAGVASAAYAPYLEQEQANAKPLSYEEAQSLGVAYGTTVGEAKALGKIPEAPTPEGYTLSEGQARYDAQGNLMAERGKTYAPGTGSGGSGGTYTPGANPNVDAWVNLIKSGQAKITSVPANLKNAVASAVSQGGGAQSETSTQASGIIDQLLARTTSGITGAVDQFTGGLWGADAYTKTLYNQLKGLLSLEKRTLLKGSGAISDYEFKVLEQAASALSRGLTDDDFRSVLAKLKVDLGGAPSEGESGSSMLVSPTGETFDASELTPEEYAEAIADGYKPQ